MDKQSLAPPPPPPPPHYTLGSDIVLHSSIFSNNMWVLCHVTVCCLTTNCFSDFNTLNLFLGTIMPKGKKVTYFDKVWLTKPEYSQWLKRGSSNTTYQCKVCPEKKIQKGLWVTWVLVL